MYMYIYTYIYIPKTRIDDELSARRDLQYRKRDLRTNDQDTRQDEAEVEEELRNPFDDARLVDAVFPVDRHKFWKILKSPIMVTIIMQ